MAATNSENISPQGLRRVAKELAHLSEHALEGITVHVNEADMTDVQATLIGPSGTPYEGGHFRMKLVLPSDFPQAPPRGYFITKIFHPNVSSGGDICVNTLKRDWKPEYGLEHILTVVKCLLIHPNPASALNEEAGRLLQEQYEDFARHAKMMTEIHAKPTAEEAKAAAIVAVDGAPAAKRPTDKVAAKKKTEKKRTLKRL